jgi:hypothetical protein
MLAIVSIRIYLFRDKCNNHLTQQKHVTYFNPHPNKLDESKQGFVQYFLACSFNPHPIIILDVSWLCLNLPKLSCFNSHPVLGWMNKKPKRSIEEL